MPANPPLDPGRSHPLAKPIHPDLAARSAGVSHPPGRLGSPDRAPRAARRWKDEAQLVLRGVSRQDLEQRRAAASATPKSGTRRILPFLGFLPWLPKRTTRCGRSTSRCRSRSSKFHCSPWRSPVPMAKSIIRRAASGTRSLVRIASCSAGVRTVHLSSVSAASRLSRRSIFSPAQGLSARSPVNTASSKIAPRRAAQRCTVWRDTQRGGRRSFARFVERSKRKAATCPFAT